MKIFYSSIFSVSLFMLVGCTPAAGVSVTTNDTWRLDSVAKHDAQSEDFAKRFKQYYKAIENEDWPTTYDLRGSNFKQDVTRSVYLKTMKDSGEHLTRYQVLNVRMYAGMGGGYTAAEIIMKFNEAGMISYSCARWVRRGGVWLCEEPGLSGFLTSTRIPDWVTK